MTAPPIPIAPGLARRFEEPFFSRRIALPLSFGAKLCLRIVFSSRSRERDAGNLLGHGI